MTSHNLLLVASIVLLVLNLVMGLPLALALLPFVASFLTP